ncbi:MAG: hypothetical protein RL012_182 [Bacteroidota bacterium]|jgi:hypothetical protein
MSRIMIILGIILCVIGLLWPWISKLGLGRLPGDIMMERENFKFYAPITTGIVLSILLSLVTWLLQKL